MYMQLNRDEPSMKITFQSTLVLVSFLLLLSTIADSSCIPSINSCSDLRIFSPKDVPTGIYNMTLRTFCYASVYCNMVTNGGGWIVIQRNRKGSMLSFNKNWREYEDGFGNLNEDFWAGLKLMNTLTQRANGKWELISKGMTRPGPTFITSSLV